MKSRVIFCLMGLLAMAAQLSAAEPALAGNDKANKPLALHPDNPHYFLFRNKAAVLITSGEHYGAVLNPDFNYIPYLDELQSRQLNLTRLFSGSYVESSISFNITGNTLAPLANRVLCPWARSSTPGYANGGNKFDLNTWDVAYFMRLKDFVSQAAKRGIVVEMVLFCPFYDDDQWELSPWKASNNVNGSTMLKRTGVMTQKSDLLAIQEAMVRKFADELKDFDNLYFEICNEPYFGGVTLEWQSHIAGILADAEKNLPEKHLIAQNIANGSAKIDAPNPAVSIFNFHYATPPTVVGVNFGLNKIIADDETGFKGQADSVYRKEGWEFILAGGAIFDNLDYSFTAGNENGTFRYPPKQPGGGGPALRNQYGILMRFLNGFDFVHMAPGISFIKNGVPNGAKIHALSQPGTAYAIYLNGGPHAELLVELPDGNYNLDWIDTLTGAIGKSEEIKHAGGTVILKSPEYTEDIALRIVAVVKK